MDQYIGNLIHFLSKEPFYENNQKYGFYDKENETARKNLYRALLQYIHGEYKLEINELSRVLCEYLKVNFYK